MSLSQHQVNQLNDLVKLTIFPALCEDLEFNDVDQAFEGVQHLLTQIKTLPLKDMVVNEDNEEE